MSDATRQLVSLLDLEQLDTDLFRGKQPDTIRQRVYGGQVAAQALIAATRSVGPEFHVHSLHSYFLLPGDYNVPIIYDVERIRDGKSSPPAGCWRGSTAGRSTTSRSTSRSGKRASTTRTRCPRSRPRRRVSTWSS